ncbi:polynucleotidyl transferase [Striga asiatica]|uniref:Polynucleotidyl transferase n=1 Tax=Striga asiatica TaxID=4170 RepID=A0A5A7QY43_STRAF|nr:polynucleotidyl transferase [Striga asiatica]
MTSFGVRHAFEISKLSHGIVYERNLLSLCRRWSSVKLVRMKFNSSGFAGWRQRTTLICAVKKDAENSFKRTVEVDRLIDMLRDANDKELQQLVAENKDYEELATVLMVLVDRLVHKTNEKIESATDVLKAILKPVVDEDEEISWPPRDPEALILMQKELHQREQEGHLDESFLSEVNAQLRQAKEDGDKPGFEAMLQKVLQLYASRVLSKRSYAKKGDEILKAEQFLETLIQAPETEWNRLLINGLNIGKGNISPEELYAVIKKRIERTLIRTEGGSYQQRVLTEYLRGIQSRAEEVEKALKGGTQ